MAIQLYVDGACIGNPGPGGYCALFFDNGNLQNTITGQEPTTTTNQRMELTAAIVGLESLQQLIDVIVVSDSEYVIKGMNEWLPGWKRRGWRNSQRKPVKNRDLWERLAAAAAPHRVRWVWVRGHNGDPHNERADQLAREAAETCARQVGMMIPAS